MKTKTVITLVAACIVVIAAVSWLTPGAPDDVNDRTDLLPLHITEISNDTLPRAIEETRLRGLTSVTVTDADENTINVDLSNPVFTTFTVSDPGEKDVVETLERALVDKSKISTVEEGEDGSVVFIMSVVHRQEIATVIYETSVRVFNIDSTGDWTIDIE